MVRTAAPRGIEAADLLEEAGLTPDSLEDADARIPGPTVLAIWHALRERTADPALQLAAPSTLPFGAYRVIDYLVAASATVGDGVRRFARFFGPIAESLRLSIVCDNKGHWLCLTTADGGQVRLMYVDHVFAALVSRVRMRIRPNLNVRRVDLRQTEGTTYREVSEAVRGELAKGYLTDPSVSVTEVAFLLGYSEESAFNRAFRRWTGESPGRWRRRRVSTTDT